MIHFALAVMVLRSPLIVSDVREAPTSVASPPSCRRDDVAIIRFPKPPPSLARHLITPRQEPERHDLVAEARVAGIGERRVVKGCGHASSVRSFLRGRARTGRVDEVFRGVARDARSSALRAPRAAVTDDNRPCGADRGGMA